MYTGTCKGRWHKAVLCVVLQVECYVPVHRGRLYTGRPCPGIQQAMVGRVS